MGCRCSRSLDQESESSRLLYLQSLLDDNSPEGSAEALDPVSQSESERRGKDWTRLGGDQLEQPLREGWVRLVRASWLVKLAEYGGVLPSRQELPQKAFIDLDELKAAGTFDDSLNGRSWLRIVVFSYPWLHPEHPDPYGENLSVIAKGLKLFVEKDAVMNHVDPGYKPYGVLIDYTSLFQDTCTEEEKRVFELAIPALNLFYSHPHTLVFKITHFPAWYPNHPFHRYKLPHGANIAPYAERGWCFAESSMSNLVKKSNMVLDLSEVGARDIGSLDLMRRCKAGRAPPLCPDNFKAELDKKTFTHKTDDFEKVVELYSSAFEQHLAGARELDYGGLGWGPHEVKKLLQAIRSNSSMQKLDLQGNRMGPAGAADLGEVLRSNTSLRELNLWQNGIGSGAKALGEALQSNTALRTLHLAQNHIDAAGAAALGEVLQSKTALRTLNLRRNDVGPQGAAALGEPLRSNTSLQVLDLGYNGIDSAGAEALGEVLQSNTSLHTLTLNDNNISSTGAAALARALQRNTTLQTLNLRHNNIGPEGTVALGEALRSNASRLRKLDLGLNQIGLAGAAAMGEALRSNTYLQTLDLEGDSISPMGGTALGGALKSNTSLQALNLKDNIISSAGATALGEALRSNTTLQSLILESNSIGSAGATALGEALKSNTSLQTLDLDFDDIGSEGAAALGEALTGNTSLHELWLRLNDIGPEGVAALGEALRSNTTLGILNLRGNPISRDGAATLVEACPSLQVFSDYHTQIKSLQAKGNGADQPMGVEGVAVSERAGSREASASPGASPSASPRTSPRASPRYSPRPFSLTYQILQEEWTI